MFKPRLAFSLIFSFVASTSWAAEKSQPSIQWFAEPKTFHNLRDQALVQEFLQSEGTTYGVAADLSNVSLREVQTSLLGTHYRYQQIYRDKDVFQAELIVSLSENGQEIVRVFSTMRPMNAMRANIASHNLSVDAAYDTAWQNIRAHGELLQAPQAEPVYLMINHEMRAVYLVDLSVTAPFGYWRQVIDAQTGKILELKDRRLVRIKRETGLRRLIFNGEATDRRAAFARFAAKQKSAKLNTTFKTTNGQGLVFDPDPRSALNNSGLQDDSDAANFDDAYLSAALLDISYDGKDYRLKGPWITIEDFESPDTAPSTSKDGKWNAKRGDNAFNDAMTYFHIDQNQRYMQSLGFTGKRGIQFASIGVDSDGVYGDDNSHFIPGDNKIAFGHGCVDDNEDADVILHEYGHAIHFSINKNWDGGDTGAMGEGFGDYWAGSYSLSKPGIPEGFIDHVFNWDGHGDDEQCWPGRVLNATGAKYDPKENYEAHQQITGGFQSDELWSAPLFQSLRTLLNQGVKRDEVDQVILEAHFGLGADITMRQMATQIVNTAKKLYPKGPHADVFKEKFKAQNILK